MNRSAIVLTSGGRIIVRGTVGDVGNRLRGVATDWVEFQQATRDRHSDEYTLTPVVIHRPQVTCVTEVE